MSRKCPKRFRLFLNWLKTSRSRFPFAPRVTRIRNNRIDFELQGISKVLRFDYYCRLTHGSCSWLSVDAIWQGEKWDGLAAFYGAEEKTDKGWITRCEPEETRRYWRTREELWTELCFEDFLKWCNSKLTMNRFLRFYEYPEQAGFFGLAGANFCKDKEGCLTLTPLEKGHISNGLGDAAVARHFAVPLLKSQCERILA